MDPRQPYPSDLSRSEWARVSRFIPAPKPGGRPAKYDRRAIVNALLYVRRAGGPGRALPHDLPPWAIVYWYFRRWKEDGTLDRLRTESRGDPRQAEGRRPPSSTASRSRPRKGGPHGLDAWRKVNGRKRPLLVDTIGPILAVVVTAADVQDPEGAKLVFGSIRGRFSRLKLVWADGISKRAVDGVASRRPARPIRLKGVERTEPGFGVLPRRWVVERTFAWLGRCRRLSQDDEATTASGEAWVKLAMIHRMARRLVRRLGA